MQYATCPEQVNRQTFSARLNMLKFSTLKNDPRSIIPRRSLIINENQIELKRQILNDLYKQITYFLVQSFFFFSNIGLIIPISIMHEPN